MNRRLAVRFTWPLPVCSSVSVFTVQSAWANGWYLANWHHLHKWSKNFDERPHPMSCRYWWLNDPFCRVHRSRDSQCFSMVWTMPAGISTLVWYVVSWDHPSQLTNGISIASAVLIGLKQQTWPSRSLNGIGIDAFRLARYDFLLVFHCNYVSFLRFRDIIRYFPKFKEVTWPWTHPLIGAVCHSWARTCYGHFVYQKCEVTNSTHYEDIYDDAKYRKWGGLGS